MSCDYFVWNLPLFVDRQQIEQRLCSRFGKCLVDVFGPKSLKHKTHSGLARILCDDEYDFGNKSELDLGYRFPVFVKNSVRRVKFPVPSKTARPADWNLHSDDYYDLNSDEKSNDSTFSISVCSTINITKPLVIMCESIDISPTYPQNSVLTCETFPVLDLKPTIRALELTCKPSPVLNVLPTSPPCRLREDFDLPSFCILSSSHESTCEIKEVEHEVDIKPELKQFSLITCTTGEFNLSTLFCDKCAKAKIAEITPNSVCSSCNHLEYVAFMKEKFRKSEEMRKKSEKQYMDTKRKLRLKKLQQSR